jgi:hypothetical protein
MANTRAKKSATATKSPSDVKPTKAPTTREAAERFSVELTPPLKPEQTARLRKALPGYVGILDDVAALLDEDAAVLNLPGVTPEAQEYSYDAPVAGPSASSNACSSAVNTRDRVRKRIPSGASSENPAPRPGTASMMSWVCFHSANCAPPM